MNKIKMSIITICAVLISSSFADWKMIHGHTGNVEYMNNVQNGVNGVVYKGWGLDVRQKSGRYNWIHWAFSDSYPENYDRICLYFKTFSADVSITAVHIWDGNNKIKSFNNLNINASNFKYEYFQLDRCTTFKKGLGISVQIGAGVEMMSHRVVFSTVYARTCTPQHQKVLIHNKNEAAAAESLSETELPETLKYGDEF